MTLISVQLGVSSAAQSVAHVSALAPCMLRGRRPVGPPLLDLTGLSVIACPLETP